MALQREIEELYQRSLELDLEKISRTAEPSHHPPSPDPAGLAIHQKIISAQGASGGLVFTDVDYQVVRIELNPLGLKGVPFEDEMEKVQKRRAKRDVEPAEFEAQLKIRPTDYETVFRKYVEESTNNAYDPIMITPRLLPQYPASELPPIITVGGVDYVLELYLESFNLYNQIRQDVLFTPFANVDQWPEELVIRHDDSTQDPVTYVRADVAYYEEDGTPQDHRFQPHSPPETENAGNQTPVEQQSPPASSGRNTYSSKKTSTKKARKTKRPGKKRRKNA